MKVDINVNVNLEELKEILTSTEELRHFVITSIQDLKNWVQDTQEYGQDYGMPGPHTASVPETVSEADPEAGLETGPGAGPGEAGAAPAPGSEPPAETASPAPSETETGSGGITMEMVRSQLSELMQREKQAEVKALLKKHGGDRLSDITPDKYPGLLKEAGEL